MVQPRVVRLRENHVWRGSTCDGVRNEFANQQAGNAGIAVGKAKEAFLRFFIWNGVPIHALARRGIKLHSGESWHLEAPRILRGNRINSQTNEALRHWLVELDTTFMHVDDIAQ